MALEAVQFIGDNIEECLDFLGDSAVGYNKPDVYLIGPLGTLRAAPNDWIIKGHNGSFTRMPEQGFNAIYEAVSPPTPNPR